MPHSPAASDKTAESGIKALAYRHLHTAVSPRAANAAPKSSLTGNQVCLWAGSAVQVGHIFVNGLQLPISTSISEPLQKRTAALAH